MKKSLIFCAVMLVGCASGKPSDGIVHGVAYTKFQIDEHEVYMFTDTTNHVACYIEGNHYISCVQLKP